MVNIYVLKLEKGKYYVGKTNNPRFRLENHKPNGSQWTKLYKPLELIEIKPNCDDSDQDKITLQYMDKYGIDNVRGGSFISIRLDKTTILEKLYGLCDGTNKNDLKSRFVGKRGGPVCWPALDAYNDDDYDNDKNFGYDNDNDF